MKRKSYLHLLAIMMVAMLSVGFASCSDDDEEEDGLVNTQNVSVQDPEGTVVINMGSGASDNFYDIGLKAQIHIDENNNFSTETLTQRESYSSPYGGGGYIDRTYHVEFASVGKVNGLGEIISAPASGWSKSIVVIPGTGYVARMMRDGDVYGKYTRLYVVEQEAEFYAAYTIKCQTPFEFPFTLEKTSVALNQQTYTTIKIINGSNSIQVAEKPDWCSVSLGTNSVYISADKNTGPQPRTGTIVLKNSVCSASITVTQDVAPVV